MTCFSCTKKKHSSAVVQCVQTVKYRLRLPGQVEEIDKIFFMDDISRPLVI